MRLAHLLWLMRGRDKVRKISKLIKQKTYSDNQVKARTLISVVYPDMVAFAVKNRNKVENICTTSTITPRRFKPMTHCHRAISLIAVVFLTLMLSAPAGAYTFWKGSHDDNQTEVWINPNCDDHSAGSPADQIRSILGGAEAGGADAWAEQVASGWLGFCFAGTTTIEQVDTADGTNLVVWSDGDGNGAIALTYCNGGSVDEGFDIVLFDQDRFWTHDGFPGGTDIKGLMTHEFGHALGLGHSGDYDSTMWPYLKGDGTANRLLNSDDDLGLKALYGFGSSGSDTCLYQPGVTGNDTCDTALDVYTGEILYGDTTWAFNDYDPGAGACTASALPGPDAVYRVSLGPNEQLDVTVSPVTPGYNPALHLFSGCGAGPIDCLAGSDAAGSGGDEVLSFMAPEAGDYFLVVDSAVAGGRGSSGLFVLSAEASVGSPGTVLAYLQCSTTASTLPCGVNLNVRVSNMADEPRRVSARLDLTAADGQIYNGIRSGSVTIGAGLEFARDVTFNLPALGMLDGTNSFRLLVEDTTPGDPSPLAGDQSEDSCAVLTTID
jgi:hypothetical protein